MSDSGEEIQSLNNDDEQPLSLIRHIRTLQHSTDRDMILDAIEELRTQARGNGTFYTELTDFGIQICIFFCKRLPKISCPPTCSPFAYCIKPLYCLE